MQFSQKNFFCKNCSSSSLLPSSLTGVPAVSLLSAGLFSSGTWHCHLQHWSCSPRSHSLQKPSEQQCASPHTECSEYTEGPDTTDVGRFFFLNDTTHSLAILSPEFVQLFKTFWAAVNHKYFGSPQYWTRLLLHPTGIGSG